MPTALRLIFYRLDFHSVWVFPKGSLTSDPLNPFPFLSLPHFLFFSYSPFLPCPPPISVSHILSLLTKSFTNTYYLLLTFWIPSEAPKFQGTPKVQRTRFCSPEKSKQWGKQEWLREQPSRGLCQASRVYKELLYYVRKGDAEASMKKWQGSHRWSKKKGCCGVMGKTDSLFRGGWLVTGSFGKWVTGLMCKSEGLWSCSHCQDFVCHASEFRFHFEHVGGCWRI